MSRKKFRQLLNENVEGINDHNVGFIISYTLHFSSQLHIWHLLTKNAQQHSALQELYDGLREEVDKLAEKFIAQGGNLETVSDNLLAYYDEKVVRRSITEYRQLITNSISNDKNIASIVDSLIDIQEILDSGLYKFDLK